MDKNDESIKIMIAFGLTRSQARSYLSLIDIGPASVKEVAKHSNVARPDTYRALMDLQELGLVEKIVTFPTRFKPLPIADAVSLLMLRRNKETVEIGKRANALIGFLSERNLKIQHSEDNQLTLILGGDAITAKLHKIMKNSKEQICVICSKMDFFQCKQFISETLQNNLSSKVTFLLLTENHAGPRELKEIRDLRKNPRFQVKYLQMPPAVCFAIFDKKEVILMDSPEVEYAKSSIIWSNNPRLIELAQSYFERFWNQTEQK
jgi:sugar-specific transcriptional regulator TrmB